VGYKRVEAYERVQAALVGSQRWCDGIAAVLDIIMGRLAIDVGPGEAARDGGG